MNLRNKFSAVLALAAMAMVALVTTSANADIVTPVSEVASGQFGDWLDTIDGTGLSGGGTSGDILSETHAAGGGGNFALFPGGPDYTGDFITFTLGADFTVDRVHLWTESSVWGDVTGFDLEFSTDGGSTFPTIASGITFAVDPVDKTVVQTRTFAQQTGVDTIRLSNVVVTGPDSGTAFAGFNEIRFGSAAIPEPSSLALFGLGSLVMLVRRRRG